MRIKIFVFLLFFPIMGKTTTVEGAFISEAVPIKAFVLKLDTYNAKISYHLNKNELHIHFPPGVSWKAPLSWYDPKGFFQGYQFHGNTLRIKFAEGGHYIKSLLSKKPDGDFLIFAFSEKKKQPNAIDVSSLLKRLYVLTPYKEPLQKSSSMLNILFSRQEEALVVHLEGPLKTETQSIMDETKKTLRIFTPPIGWQKIYFSPLPEGLAKSHHIDTSNPNYNVIVIEYNTSLKLK